MCQRHKVRDFGSNERERVCILLCMHNIMKQNRCGSRREHFSEFFEWNCGLGARFIYVRHTRNYMYLLNFQSWVLIIISDGYCYASATNLLHSHKLQLTAKLWRMLSTKACICSPKLNSAAASFSARKQSKFIELKGEKVTEQIILPKANWAVDSEPISPRTFRKTPIRLADLLLFM